MSRGDAAGTYQTRSGAWVLESRPLPRQNRTFRIQREKEKAHTPFKPVQEKIPLRLVRHKCWLGDYLSGLLNKVEAEIQGLKLEKYSA